MCSLKAIAGVRTVIVDFTTKVVRIAAGKLPRLPRRFSLINEFLDGAC
jgi:hypothetical protein